MRVFLVFFISLQFFSLTNLCYAQDLVWAKSLVGRGISTVTNLSPGHSYAQAMAVDHHGNVYITGHSNDTVDFDPGPNEVLLKAGNDDIFIAKYDSLGTYLWANVFWSPGHNYGTKLKLDLEGNIILTGYARSYADFDPSSNTAFLGNNATANYVFIAKYDANGNYIWAKEIGNNFGTFCGDMALDSNNNIFITGHFYGTIDMDPGPDTAMLVSYQTGVYTAKYDSNGNYLWANCLSGVGNLGESMSVACSPSGSVIVAGIFGNTVDFDPTADTFNITANTSCDRFLMRYTNNGNFIWAKSFNVNEDGGLFVDRMIKIVIDLDENIYLTGNFKDTVDFNPGQGVFNIESPTTTSSYLCKYNFSGQFLWAKGLIGGSVQTTDIALDCENNICLAGSFAKADFNPSSGIYQFQSSASSAFNNFYAKYNSSGGFIWVHQIGNNGYGGSTLSISLVLRNGYLHLAGGFKHTGNFDPTGTYEIQAKGVGQNAFFAKYLYQNYSNVLQDTTLCDGQNWLLDVSGQQGTFLWNDSTNLSSLLINKPGKYWVEITSESCKTIDTVQVSAIKLYPLNFNDTTICEGSSVTLTTNNPASQYLWSDNSTHSNLTVNHAGNYWLTVTKGHCTLTDTITIDTKICETEIAYPNIFTPNADGFNEAFIPIKMKGINSATLVIYSRWGQKIFETSDLIQGWNGKIKNSMATAGVYYWIVYYKDIYQTASNLKGFVTVLN
jgi:gliding motility-associated-like protein